MKRNNGGYVLVYVVVVIVILCILVPAACSNSLQNLKAQQASIERMQQLYTAEGQIERFVAEVEAIPKSGKGSSDRESTAKNDAKTAVKNVIENASTNVLDENVTKNEEPIWECLEDTDTLNCKFSLVSKASDIVINAVIKVDLKVSIQVEEEKGGEENSTDKYLWSYKITDCTITYESYEISTTTAGEGENQS